jgi:RNA polymerase sigma-70 factor (ECF subfamily)
VTDSTQWTVIRRAATGDPDGRAEFARRYNPVIRAYLGGRWRKTPLITEIDDAAQQVFVECFKEGGILARVDHGRGSAFRGYLYGAVRNVARGVERKRMRAREQQPDSKLDLEAFASDEESLARVFDRAWASALMRDAAELQLARAQGAGHEAVRRHELLALRFGENRPIREIAADWEVEAAWLHHQYAKAREEFRAALLDVLKDAHGGDAAAVERECERLSTFF